MNASRMGSVSVMVLIVGLFSRAMNPQLAFGQTIQLPTVSQFGIGTTVVIPDRGSAYLGGVSRAAEGSATSGVPGLSKIPGANRMFTNRGIGRSVEAKSAWASATIIDHAEIDNALLGEARANRVPSEAEKRAAAVAEKAGFLSRNVGRRSDQLNQVAGPSPEQKRATEALEYFEKGKEARSAGKPSVAKVHYEMAARRATGDLKRRVDAALQAVSPPHIAARKPTNR